MKKYLLVISVLIWISIAAAGCHYGLLSMNLNELKALLNQAEESIGFLFVLFFSLRILLFIPSSVFILTGSMLFSVWENLIFALLSMFITESLIYFYGRYLNRARVITLIAEKYPKLYGKMNRKKYIYLFSVIALPAAPTDFACLLASALRMKYLYYIGIVLIGYIPLILLYSLFGKVLMNHSSLMAILSATVLAGCVLVIVFKSKKELSKEC
ncbi:TVP38/TMEM64 family protein [Bacillus massiliglaciei]|uniref:TVP38/TMEM64 family protein n=1 Tax=Bacillus massiliglaciei TaxID=1816693 RepID=UPI0018FE918C|nr:VTT domain-containing protein [Bacillus massiliglaciei]